LIWAVGVLYDELPSMITENKDDCKDTLTKWMKNEEKY
jgi:hypothetical protein